MNLLAYALFFREHIKVYIKVCSREWTLCLDLVVQALDFHH